MSNVGLPLVEVSKVAKSSCAKEQRVKEGLYDGLFAFPYGTLLAPLIQSMKKQKATEPMTKQRQQKVGCCCVAGEVTSLGWIQLVSYAQERSSCECPSFLGTTPSPILLRLTPSPQ